MKDFKIDNHKKYKVSTNQPYFLAQTRKNIELDFLGNIEYSDGILLILTDIFGDSFINEIKKLTELIKKYPVDVPCYMIGAKTRVPNYNFKYYRSAERDKAIKEFMNEVTNRSRVILVADKITKDWLVKEFGCDADGILYFEGNRFTEENIKIH